MWAQPERATAFENHADDWPGFVLCGRGQQGCQQERGCPAGYGKSVHVFACAGELQASV